MLQNILLEVELLVHIILNNASITDIIEKYGCEHISDNEVIIRVPDTEYCVIVSRRLFGNWFTRVEPLFMRAENSSVKHKIAIGNHHSSMQLNMWNSFRINLKGKASICTCSMPSIVASVLFNYYKVQDRSFVLEVSRKLLPFGTKHFGVKEFEAPTGENATFPWSWTTPYSICYTPEELETICEICYEIVKNAKSIDEIRNYDMNLFKKELHEKTKDIKPSLDILMFGRNTNNSGLRDFNACVSIGEPVLV